MMESGKAILLFFMLTCFFGSVGCKNKVKPVATNLTTDSLRLDTGKIHSALRAFDALPGETKGKAKMLNDIRQDAIAMGYNEEACYLSLDLARGQADRGNLDSARIYFEEARPFCNDPLFDKTLPATFLSEYASFYHSLRSDFVAANQGYYEALSYLKENNLTDTELTVALYLFLAVTQEKLGHLDEAFKYLREGEELALKLGTKQVLAGIWGHLGYYHANRSDDSLAMDYFNRAIAFESEIWDPNIITSALIGKASLLTKTGNPSMAIPVLEKAIEISRREVVIYSEVAATIELGEAYNKLGRFKETIQKVMPVMTSHEFNTDRETGFKVLLEAYEGLGDYKRALEYQRDMYEWRDSIINVEKVAALQELELKFQTANKDKEIASNELLIAQQKNKLERKNTLLGFISAAALLILAVIVVLYKNADHKKRVSELRLKTIQRQQEIDLLKSSMEGEEQERQRLARELHDGIGSMISSAIMRLSLLKKQEKGLDNSENYNDVLRLLQETGSEVRKTAHNMMPDTIYKQTISDAVETYCESISKGTTLSIDTQFYGVEDEFTPHCKLVIYRIIQELVHNIVKHANATHAIVQGVMNEDRFTITVEDNGKGFDISSGKSGMGLKNVASRVKSLCGDFQVESAPGKGTTVYIEFDCNEIMKKENS